MRTNTSDYESYSKAPKPVAIENDWHAELERHWPMISVIAKRLYTEYRDRKLRQANKQRWRARRRTTAKLHRQGL
ncbi:hypothetical protein Mkiyose1088_52610 [Mycobacterium kiyosense]|nr:hypothetical protein Mkiyose1088_52610 [Mycobacterium kiyosense]